MAAGFEAHNTRSGLLLAPGRLKGGTESLDEFRLDVVLLSWDDNETPANLKWYSKKLEEGFLVLVNQMVDNGTKVWFAAAMQCYQSQTPRWVIAS